MFKDYDKYLSTSLNVYVFVLLLVFIMKLVGMDYFGLDTSNPTIIKVRIISIIEKAFLNFFIHTIEIKM